MICKIWPLSPQIWRDRSFRHVYSEYCQVRTCRFPGTSFCEKFIRTPHMLKSCLYNTFSFLLPLPYAAVPDDPQIRGCSVFVSPPVLRNPKNRQMPGGNKGNTPEIQTSPQSRTGHTGNKQDLSSFPIESGGTKRRSCCIVITVRRNEAGYSLIPPDVNTITACGCLHISLRYYR